MTPTQLMKFHGRAEKLDPVFEFRVVVENTFQGCDPKTKIQKFYKPIADTLPNRYFDGPITGTGTVAEINKMISEKLELEVGCDWVFKNIDPISQRDYAFREAHGTQIKIVYKLNFIEFDQSHFETNQKIRLFNAVNAELNNNYGTDLCYEYDSDLAMFPDNRVHQLVKNLIKKHNETR
jgi:hypothetical protein